MLSCYDKNFIFKGTFDNNSTSKEKKLQKYFKNFIKDVKKVVFLKNNITIKTKDTIIDSGKYNFYTNDGEIIKAEYQFVLKNKNFKIISHFSLLIK